MVTIDYKSEVTLEQVMAFDPERPETHTTSAFMNAVCRSFAKNGYRSGKEIARSLGISDRNFAAAFEVLTGVRYADVRGQLLEKEALKLHRLHPHWSTTRIANELGFRSLGSLWNFISKEAYKKLQPESRAQYLRRMAREFDKQLKQESLD